MKTLAMSPLQPVYHTQTYITRKSRNDILEFLTGITPRDEKEESQIDDLVQILQLPTNLNRYISFERRQTIDDLIKKHEQNDDGPRKPIPSTELTSSGNEKKTLKPEGKLDAFMEVIKQVAELSNIDFSSPDVVGALTEKFQALNIQVSGPVRSWDDYLRIAKRQVARELEEEPEGWGECVQILKTHSETPEAFPNLKANLVDDIFVRFRSLHSKLLEEEDTENPSEECALLQDVIDSMLDNCERLAELD